MAESDLTGSAAAAQAAAVKRSARDSATTIHLKTGGFNPKKGKSRARFALYRDGMTVQAYLDAGGYRADLPWDVKRKLISLKGKGATFYADLASRSR